MRGSDYADLRALAAIAEYRSFARAASQLGVSPSALSQTIRALEERLGARLLNRTTRSVAPTEAGARLLDRLLPAFADMDSAIAALAETRDRPSGLLRINAPRAAVHFLAPLIPKFLNAYPDIALDLVTDDRLVDIVANRFDAGVRLGEKIEKDMVAVKFSGDLEMMVVGSPDYLKRYGVPKTPRDLAAHRCLNFRWPTDLSLYRWEFERGDEKVEVAVEGPLTFNEPDIAIHAAVESVGLAYLLFHQVAPLLATGALKRVLQDWSPPFPGFYLYYPSRRQTPPALRAFVAFIRQPSNTTKKRKHE
jgi:DNA-binding transcriptional LysR family regulator